MIPALPSGKVADAAGNVDTLSALETAQSTGKLFCTQRTSLASGWKSKVLTLPLCIRLTVSLGLQSLL